MNVTDLQMAAHGTPSARQLDQIRNWTRERLVPFIGPYNPGTGRSRQYGPEAIEIVKILDLAARLGMRVYGRGKFLKKVAVDRELRAALELLVDALERS